jgi:hypothetical protein
MLTVHVRITDAATGKQTPARVRFLDGSGQLHVPFGRLVDFATRADVDVGGHLLNGTSRYCYVDGACEVRLPAGRVTVEVHKGPEYSPLRREVTLGPGQIALRLAIERWTDMRAEGWYSGDTRCHFLSPHAALLEGAAEDVAVVNLLVMERPATATMAAAMSNMLAFSGTKPCLEIPGHLVAVNTLNVHPFLGVVALLDSHRPVFPLRFGGSAWLDDWSVADWCDQCHRKRGLVVWADFGRMTEGSPQGETLAALLLGKVDAFEISAFGDTEPAVLGDWYRLLDCGLRVPLVAGSGKGSNMTALGAVRTYAHLAEGQPLSYAAWIEAVKAGRTFVTNGPLLTLTADGSGPGTTIRLPSEGKRLPIRIEARGTAAFDRVELLVNGAIVASKEASGNRQSAVLEVEIAANENAWLAARCWGREHLPDGQCIYAHTSPIYLKAEGPSLTPSRETTAPLLAILDRSIDWVQREARCETEHQREHLLEVLCAGRARLTGGD